MMPSAKTLRTLHRLLKQQSDLRDRLSRGPKQIKARENLLAKAKEEQQALLDKKKQTRMAVDHKQLNLKTGEAKVADLQVKLNMAANNREYQALQDQIAAVKMANSVLSDEILEAMEKLDTLEKEIATSNAAVAKTDADLLRTRDEVSQSKGDLESELARVSAELAAAEEEIPPEFKKEYQRVVSTKFEAALAVVEADACTGCYQQLTTNMMSDLAMGRSLVCRVCGAFLYLPEDRGQSLSRR